MEPADQSELILNLLCFGTNEELLNESLASFSVEHIHLNCIQWASSCWPHLVNFEEKQYFWGNKFTYKHLLARYKRRATCFKDLISFYDKKNWTTFRFFPHMCDVRKANPFQDNIWIIQREHDFRLRTPDFASYQWLRSKILNSFIV